MITIILLVLSVGLAVVTASAVWRDRQEKLLLPEDELKELGVSPVKSALFDAVFCGLLVAVVFYATAYKQSLSERPAHYSIVNAIK